MTRDDLHPTRDDLCVAIMEMARRMANSRAGFHSALLTAGDATAVRHQRAYVRRTAALFRLLRALEGGNHG